MKKVKKGNKDLNINPLFLASLGIGSISLLVLHEISLSKKVTKLSKSFRRFTNIVTETEEERQKYEFECDLRLGILEDMMEDIYKEVEVYGEFEDIDGTEV